MSQLLGLWYQNEEAVRVLRKAREEGARLWHVVDDMRARNLLDISYQAMMQKVKMVDDAVAASEGRISAEDIILHLNIVCRIACQGQSCKGWTS
jgi:N-acetylglucosamine-6-phosphate deacetylase